MRNSFQGDSSYATTPMNSIAKSIAVAAKIEAGSAAAALGRARASPRAAKPRVLEYVEACCMCAAVKSGWFHWNRSARRAESSGVYRACRKLA
jgi:hypothetical protein